MLPQADNPYAPPDSDSRQSGSARWFVENGVLWVRDGADLPRLDSSPGLSQIRRKTFRSNTGWRVFVPAAPLVGLLVTSRLAADQLSPEWQFAGSLAAGGLCWILHRMTCHSATISFRAGYFSQRSRNFQKWISALLTLAAALWSCVYFSSTAQTANSHYIAVGLMILGLVWFCISSYGDIRSVGYSEGWFALSGIDDDVIRWLPADSPPSHDPAD